MLSVSVTYCQLKKDLNLNILITPPEKHFDRGLGISAWQFKDAAKALMESDKQRDLISPVCYLQRHAIELYLKSLIYILHRKYAIPFGDSFGLDNPAILVNCKWKALSSTHNLTDLYNYFISIFESNFNLLPKTTDWTLPEKLGSQINLISGYDPKSTYFRYPEATSAGQDKKKSTVQPMDLVTELEKKKSDNTTPIKCAIMLDSEDNVVGTYDLVSDPLVDVRESLSNALEGLNSLHCAFLGELTKWS